jgi:ketosteroid isomerase-like protein
MTKTLEERVLAMEDVHEIMNLKAHYLRGSNGGWNRPSHDADTVASTFAEDGWWEVEGFARLNGRNAIHAAFRKFTVQAPFAFHTVSNPFVEVDGDCAFGEWHLTEVFTDSDGQEFWAAGVYTDHFVRVRNRWLIKSLSLAYAYSGQYKNGFAAAIRMANPPPR